ncbi:hypothetical protein NDU88_001663 [Pleurodeles waltl]|uniref:Uncharacterized protein n=1 Tax=Pleurodeles waltl TaxID=8319 RepID=A0AAV7UWN4_PLEWA|nr:hypothetical protein NDU88_001663 [Pleurodeles waltl]
MSVSTSAVASEITKQVDTTERDNSESDVSNQSEVEGVKSQILKEFDLMAQERRKAQRGRGAQGFKGRGRGGREGGRGNGP